MWGCDAAQDENGEWTGRKAIEPVVFDGEDYWGCLRRPVKDDPEFFRETMLLYGLFKEGTLADDGGLSSQAMRYVNLMRLVSTTVAECNEVKREEAQRG